MNSSLSCPLLSVIVPNYNNAIYLNECIHSILSQTYTDYEIIISDDHSTDSSVAIIKEYLAKHPERIRAIFHNKNRGVAYNRHAAILEARGNYITTLDSDDYYYDQRKLEKEMALVLDWKIRRNQDVCSFSNAMLVNSDRTVIRMRGTPERIKEGDLLNEFMGRSCEIPINYIVTRDLYHKVGGFAFDIPIYEDWDLKIRIASICPFYYTGIIGTAYRKHGQGLSSVNLVEHIKWLKIIFNKNNHLLKKEHKRVYNSLEIAINKYQDALDRN